jgi:Ca2+-binding EF-hand superfamily protein
VGAEVVLLHRASNRPLGAALATRVPTLFGPELSAHAFRHTSHAVASGAKARAAQAPNKWTFVASASAAAAVDTRGLKPLDAEALMERVRLAINERGAYGLRGLARAFAVIDDAGDGALDREDFKWGLYDYGVRLADEEFELVMDYFDRDGNGVISFNEFLSAVRGPVPVARRAVIDEAFAKLDSDASGTLTLADVKRLYDASKHPEVVSGRKSADDVLREFMAQWDTVDLDGVITGDEFARYYEDVSASIDSDAYFDRMMRNAWNLAGADKPGGDGSLRVRVTFKTGRTAVVYVPKKIVDTYKVGDGSDMLKLVTALEEGLGVLGVYRAKLETE